MAKAPKFGAVVLYEKTYNETISEKSYPLLWATIIAFKKTARTKYIFDCMKMVQENYEHYVQLHNILGYTFRNDFALTIALRIVNGQTECPSDYMPWDLLHVSKDIKVYRNSDTSYLAIETIPEKKKYCIVSDTDFHCLGKETFIGLMNE